MATGVYMGHLLKHCPNVTHLAIRKTILLTMGPLCDGEKAITNTSIQDLNLHEVAFGSPFIFLVLSEHLVSLSNLQIRHPDFAKYNLGRTFDSLGSNFQTTTHIIRKFVLICHLLHSKV